MDNKYNNDKRLKPLSRKALNGRGGGAIGWKNRP